MSLLDLVVVSGVLCGFGMGLFDVVMVRANFLHECWIWWWLEPLFCISLLDLVWPGPLHYNLSMFPPMGKMAEVIGCS